jgi:hypothetical protein
MESDRPIHTEDVKVQGLLGEGMSSLGCNVVGRAAVVFFGFYLVGRPLLSPEGWSVLGLLQLAPHCFALKLFLRMIQLVQQSYPLLLYVELAIS